MRSLKYASLFVTLFSIPSLADIASYCNPDTPGINSISRPYINNLGKKTRFQFHYRRLNANNSNLAVIYLPGGPGDSSIRYSLTDYVPTEIFKKIVPTQYDVILIDPRGVGCSGDVANTRPDFYTTENQADDVIALVKELQLRRYILLGDSYGTVVATVAASKIALNAEVTKPQAIVLRGTLGRYMTDPMRSIQVVWKNTFDQMNPHLQKMFTENQFPDFGLNNENVSWAKYLLDHIKWGTFDLSGASLNEKLAVLTVGKHSDPQWQDLKLLFRSNYNDFPVNPDIEKYRGLWCRELAPYDNEDIEIRNGTINGPVNPQYCDGFSATSRYDSKSWQMRAPIFYFHGTKDPLVNIADALYHFEHQINSKKLFVQDTRSGHFPTFYMSDEKNCLDGFWNSFENGENPELVLRRNCDQSVIVQ